MFASSNLTGAARAAVTGAAVLVLGMSTDVRAQGATILGSVVEKSSQSSIGYVIVNAVPGGQEQFTSAGGTFTMRGLAPGRVTVTARHVGYVRIDTTIALAANDTVRLRFELSPDARRFRNDLSRSRHISAPRDAVVAREPRQVAAGYITVQVIRADFREAIPGVPVVDRVSSLVFPKEKDDEPLYEPATETHRTLAIRFLRGTP